ncbi:A-kinase anchor protein 14 [Denticeps clupeoides]|uniref:A-kinase anchor protein 14 n=1 Tax=Denticeps clupeoides TaxID=299321 RepID=A0AAY4DD04_9TELE|nr:A-kinase anchor protein 14 [Denticeps clupeoides]
MGDRSCTPNLAETASDSPRGVETSDPGQIGNINWVACKDFTVETGKKQIEEYIRTWGVGPEWRVSLDFLRETELDFHTQYQYRTQWSVPTPRGPIPRATASVYFLVLVSKTKPRTLPVEVYFSAESHHLQLRPGRIRFREKWLRDIVDSKTFLQTSVHF